MTHEHPVDPTNSEALLRTFEPVIRFTKGEWFYPMDVEPYVRSCSLWVQHPDEEAVCVVPQGKLTLETLGQQPLDSADAVHYLKIPAPEKSRKRGLWRACSPGTPLEAPIGPKRPSAPVGADSHAWGYVSRLADALFSLVLLLRGRVPGEGVEGARVMYGDLMEKEEHYQYHGRVVRQAGWIVLQYWLFYPFNDWRSNFFGANDHEADWEKVFVYLSESESGEILPEWVAYAAHEEAGDRLRRRWDDPELEKIDEHPVVYVCAGSHASRYFRGEYLTELEFRCRVASPEQERQRGSSGTRRCASTRKKIPPSCSPSLSWTTDAVTGCRLDRIRTGNGTLPGSWKTLCHPGCPGIGGCGVSTPGIRSKARMRPPGPCTTANKT
jgi:hypothetical protein